ncbi:hypothetical protein [Streptomyces sp. NBC_00057]|uniref:hypothetical protein n=1 Tax=Streptomyces sp. NBC_00057 TaxID=2975634 RepID=UPI00325428E4
MAAVIAVLAALRPALGRRCDPPNPVERGIDNHSGAFGWIQSLDEQGQLRAEATRLVMLRTLARRKYWLIRLAADLTVAAQGVAGSALLITLLTL